ncbi:MAG: hypothetical protein FWC89_04890 [Defluviitaleaceae bacterium]|nr:hypothetical protein [Defluviitaleaceae bacterium]
MNPDEAFVKDILSRDSDYWGDSCSEASLDVVSDGGANSNVALANGSTVVHLSNNHSLVFFKVEKYGFFITELPNDNAPYKKMDEIDLVPYDMGGECFMTPSCCYFTEEEAAKILMSFIENEGIVDLDEWKNIHELIEEYGFEYDESDDDPHDGEFFGYGKYFDTDGNFIGKPKTEECGE